MIQKTRMPRKRQIQSSLLDRVYSTHARPNRSEATLFMASETSVLPSPRNMISHADVLNRYTDHKNPEQAKHIMKYIFPREFRLHNVFTHATDRRETTHAFKDYTDREQEIKVANRSRDEKVLRRLAAVLPLISKMQKLQKVCAYDALIKYYCAPRENESLDEPGKDVSFETAEAETDSSKLWTQKDLSTLSLKQGPMDVQPPIKDIDIIQHHIPHHRVRSEDMSPNCRS